uniref:Serine/threonine-protein phosphatase 6 regulatory subunit 3-like isoform X2 n=1 Tax=Rhizophora mucronata TaxID=61149 RepID=A0A2P2P9K1_RHIMU
MPCIIMWRVSFCHVWKLRAVR